MAGGALPQGWSRPSDVIVEKKTQNKSPLSIKNTARNDGQIEGGGVEDVGPQIQRMHVTGIGKNTAAVHPRRRYETLRGRTRDATIPNEQHKR